MFVWINNVKNFLIGDIPTYHPDTMDYVNYWRRHKRRCIEGYWGPDDNINIDIEKEQDWTISNKWRWMPGQLYFYVNFGTIEHQKKGSARSAPKVKMRPYLRDIEWEFFYNYVEARGLSGFENCPYTSVRDVNYEHFSEDFWRKECTKENGEIDKVKWNNVFNDDGTIKEYRPIREIVRDTWEQPLGQALWNNEAQDLMVLGSRGFGKSFILAHIFLCEFLFDGAFYYEDHKKDPFKIQLFMGAGIASKSSEVLSKLQTAFNNLPGEFGSGENVVPSPISKSTSGNLEPGNSKNPFRHEYKKKIGGDWQTVGTGSKIIHEIFTVENPEAAAGTRPMLIGVEEVGLLPNLLTVQGSNDAAQREGTTKFGTTIYIGTGGNMEKIKEPEKIFRNPLHYNCVPFDDNWESTGKIGWFVPCQYALNQFKDENGNTNVEAATTFKKRVRAKLRKGKDSNSIDAELMNYPMVPSEMFLSKRGNLFPIDVLRQRKIKIQERENYYRIAKPVQLFFDESALNGVSYKIVSRAEYQPLEEFPLPSSIRSREGCPVIFEFPIEISKDGKSYVPPDLYIVTVDPYSKDDELGESLASVQVWKTRAHPELGFYELVAEYYGRPYEGRDKVNEIVEKFSMLYGDGRNIVYESDTGNVYDYFFRKRKLRNLCYSVQVSKSSREYNHNKRSYGNVIGSRTGKIDAINYGVDLLKEMGPGIDNKVVSTIDKLWSKRLIEELIAFNLDGNFDGVMAFLQAALELNERVNVKLEGIKEKNKEDPMDYLLENPKLFKNVDRRAYEKVNDSIEDIYEYINEN